MSLILSHTRKEGKYAMNFRITVSYHKSLCKYVENATQTPFFPLVVCPTVQEISSYFKCYDMTHRETDLREQNRWLDKEHELWEKNVCLGM